MCALDFAGLETVPGAMADELLESVRRETGLDQVYAGLSPGDAAAVGTDIAFDIFFVAVQQIAMSPGGSHLYVTSQGDRAVVVFERDVATGSPRVVQLVGDEVGGLPVSFENPLSTVAVSLNGQNAYLVDTGRESDGALFVFAREDTSGELSVVDVRRFREGELRDFSQPESVALSPDGGQVYVAHTGGPVMGILVFARAGDGALTAVQLESEEGIRPFFLVTSDDGKNVYSFVGDGPADRVLRTFSRNNAGQIQFVDSLLLRAGVSPGDLGLSPDGRHAYVVY